MGLSYFVSLLLILPLILYYYLSTTYNYWKKRNVVSPKSSLIFGNVKEAFFRRKNMGVVFQEIYNMYPDEKVVGVYTMTTPNLLIRDLDIIKHILIKDFDVFIDRGLEFGKKGISANLFFAAGDLWRSLRSRFTPVFTTSKLKNMFYLMSERADTFVDFIAKECRSNIEQEAQCLVKKFTIASISACAFGIDIDTLGEDLTALDELDKLIFEPSYGNYVNMMFPGIFKKLNYSPFSSKIDNFFRNLVRDVVMQRDGKPSGRNDFMDLILELRQQSVIKTTAKFGPADVSIELTDSVIAAQAFVFYVAGYETSATTLSYFLHEMAFHPEIQDKLIEEIDESLRVNDGKITYESLQEMKYLDKVVNETLRVYSLVEPLQRQAKADYTLPGTDIVVKKGQTVFISPRGIHHDPKYYSNPEVFDPERFAPDVTGMRHPCAYLPFGDGPRNCIGMRFGIVQTRLCAAKILSRFRVEPSNNSKRILEIEPHRGLIGPKGGVYINIVPRK